MRIARMALRLSLALPLLVGLEARGVRAEPPEGRGLLRVGVAARAGPHSTLTPLVYWGGFQTKTTCYEGLVAFGADGALVPRLLEDWGVSADGRTWTLRVNPDVAFHDGQRLDADTVRDHLVRWRGNPANAWLGSTERFERFDVVDPRTVRVVLSEPWPFLEECAGAINPAFLVGQGAYDNEGTFQRTLGSGPYELVDQVPNERYRFRANDAWWGGPVGLAGVELLTLPSGHAESPKTIALVQDGVVDLVADGSSPLIPREPLAALAADQRFQVWEGPGSAVTCLVLNTEKGPLADRALRRRVAHAIDRSVLVERGELGHAVPSTTLFLGGRAGWPATGHVPQDGVATRGTDEPLRMVVFGALLPRMQRHVDALTEQLAKAGLTFRVEATTDRATYYRWLEEGRWSLTFRDTYGAPYDPWITLQALFHDRPKGETASSRAPLWRDEALRAHIARAFTSRDPSVRRSAFAAAQARIDEEVPLIPLFVPNRIAVSRAGVEGLRVGLDGYDLSLATVTCPASWHTEVAAAAGPAGDALPTVATTPEGSSPSSAEVPLPAADGWNAYLALDNQGVGIWTVASMQVFPRMGCPEIVGLDDKGRCHVLWSYSGKWSPMETIQDGTWLGGLAHADVDPRIPGAELYTGGENGNLYQVVAHRWRVLDNRLLAHLPGRAINTIVAADVDPALPGRELLLFTWPGGLYRATATGEHGTFETTLVEDDIGRVRDALVLTPYPGQPVEIAVVSRNGLLQVLRFQDGKSTWEDVYEAPMGMGRLALRPPTEGRSTVLYTTHDDGRVLRHERTGPHAWTTETIYLGEQGPRGVAAGRFHEDPGVESIAIFGYSHVVEILTRGADGTWAATPIFHDIDKGHWISVAEVEGRNATDELVCSGYGGRIVLLARPPGYGRPEPVSPRADTHR